MGETHGGVLCTLVALSILSIIIALQTYCTMSANNTRFSHIFRANHGGVCNIPVVLQEHRVDILGYLPTNNPFTGSIVVKH